MSLWGWTGVQLRGMRTVVLVQVADYALGERKQMSGGCPTRDSVIRLRLLVG